jgi:hypothetical protein
VGNIGGESRYEALFPVDLPAGDRDLMLNLDDLSPPEDGGAACGELGRMDIRRLGGDEPESGDVGLIEVGLMLGVSRILGAPAAEPLMDLRIEYLSPPFRDALGRSLTKLL